MEQRIEKIGISNLELDLFNPRLPKSKQGTDENTVIEFLLLEAATLELMEAIGENDFFAGEMLLVIPDSANEGKYIVVEGNRRLTAVLLLNNPELTTVKKVATKEIYDKAKYHPHEIPCLVFSERRDIQKYLGFVHITGKKSWRMLEKARYLSEIRESEQFRDLSFQNACVEIARIIGSKSPYVKKLLVSYLLFLKIEDEKFYNIDGLSDESFFLNYFSDGLQKENIRVFLNVDFDSENPTQHINDEHLKEIVTWWFKKTEGVSRVIGDSEGMRLLNEVVGNADALSAFRNGLNIQQAYELTNDLDNQFERKIKDAYEALEQADRLSNKVKVFYADLYEDLKGIRTIAKKINDFKTKREEDGDEF
ncbi:MAG: hypothetical protein MJZ85_08485 [Bacteroidales bacterium]|nr:hypothetical protein [Bacteroidales bacterium]